MDIIVILVLVGLFILAAIVAVNQAKERKNNISELPKGGTPTDVEPPSEHTPKVPTKRDTPIIK